MRPLTTSEVELQNEAERIEEHAHYPTHAIIVTTAHAHRQAVLHFSQVRMLSDLLRYVLIPLKWKNWLCSWREL